MQTVITSINVYTDVERNRESLILAFVHPETNDEDSLFADAGTITLAIESAKVARQFAVDVRDAGLAFAARALKGRTIEFHEDDRGRNRLDSIGVVAASPAAPAVEPASSPSTSETSKEQ